MKTDSRINIISVSLFFSITFFLFAPFEMYISNKDEMWFKIPAFWWIPVLACVVVFTGVSVIGFLLPKGMKTLYTVLLFAFALCIYIQGNFLNIDVGVMNGGSIIWAEYTQQMLLNLVIWVILLVGSTMFSICKTVFSQRVYVVISLFLTGVQIITLCVLLLPTLMNKKYTNSVYTFVSDEGLYEVGQEENVIFFCLDMFDDRYFRAIYEKEADIAYALDGFTYFSNFTGTYSTTSYSLPHLFTGRTYLNEGELYEWSCTQIEKGTYIDEFTDNGYDLGIYSIGYSVIPDKYVKESYNYVEAPLYITNYLHFSFDLYQLVACKYLPDLVKPYLWMDGTEFDVWKGYKSDYKPYDGTNASFRDGLNNGITIADTDRLFKFIHINASHYPYDIDENANDVEADSVTDVQCARGALKLVQCYMEGMKENGSYDDSVIIITADHGYYWDGVLTNPVCLIKPQGARGTITVNSSPVCQVDIPATLVDLSKVDASFKFGKTMFEYEETEKRNRYFYQYYLGETDSSWKWRLIEYEIDSEGNCRENFHLTDNEYTVKGNKIPHAKYCKTCNGEYTNKEDELQDPPRIVHVKRSNYPE